MGLFKDRKNSQGKTTVPVWFMRQAGRYHNHYQNIKKDSDFISMCKTPELARDITMGPIEEFNFDAAILFSDLLFPLEQLGLGLKYAPGPKLDRHLDSPEKIKGLSPIAPAHEFYDFQKKACALLKKSLPSDRTLLGFVGAPWTLYTYAVDGGHAGNLINPKKGLFDGRWQGFCEVLFENLITEMDLQVQGGADAICLFDTAAGECALREYKEHIIPQIKKITKAFKQKNPDTPIIYYSKHTHIHYHRALEDENIDVLGVDWRMDITQCLKELGPDYMIQGNLDPALLHLPWNDLEKVLGSWWNEMNEADIDLSRWIAGLGHGVLQHTPEQNVAKTVQYIHNNFKY